MAAVIEVKVIKFRE